MPNEKFSQLPTVPNATLNDIICAVQSGQSVKETLSQVQQLMLANTILSFAGNPNGNLAGSIYQLCWDSDDHLLFVCTTTGTSLTAVWTLAIPDTFTGVEVNSASQTMTANSGYIANNGSLCTLTLPASAPLWSSLKVVGKGAGGWAIAQLTGQSIHIGSSSTTPGTGGSIASTNQYDSISLVCTVEDLVWTADVAPQGIITII